MTRWYVGAPQNALLFVGSSSVWFPVRCLLIRALRDSSILVRHGILFRTRWRFTILMVILDRVYPVGYPSLYGFEYEARNPAPLEKPDFEGEYNGGRPGPVA